MRAERFIWGEDELVPDSFEEINDEDRFLSVLFDEDEAGPEQHDKGDEGKWVTIRGNPVFIEDGVITKGPKALIGQKPGAKDAQGAAIIARVAEKPRSKFARAVEEPLTPALMRAWADLEVEVGGLMTTDGTLRSMFGDGNHTSVNVVPPTGLPHETSLVFVHNHPSEDDDYSWPSAPDALLFGYHKTERVAVDAVAVISRVGKQKYLTTITLTDKALYGDADAFNEILDNEYADVEEQARNGKSEEWWWRSLVKRGFVTIKRQKL